MNYIKIYGKQRTGTNYIAKLFKQNFQIDGLYVNIFGWKHGLFQDPIQWLHNNRYMLDDIYVHQGCHQGSLKKLSNQFQSLMSIVPQLKFIFLVKDPYASILSYLKYYNIEINDHYWIKEQAIDYSLKYRNYFNQSKNKNSILIKYEDIITNPNKTILLIENKLKIQRKHTQLQDVKGIVDSREQEHNNFTKKMYYINRDYLKEFTPYSLKIINQNLDFKLFKDLDYELYY